MYDYKIKKGPRALQIMIIYLDESVQCRKRALPRLLVCFYIFGTFSRINLPREDFSTGKVFLRLFKPKILCVVPLQHICYFLCTCWRCFILLRCNKWIVKRAEWDFFILLMCYLPTVNMVVRCFHVLIYVHFFRYLLTIKCSVFLLVWAWVQITQNHDSWPIGPISDSWCWWGFPIGPCSDTRRRWAFSIGPYSCTWRRWDFPIGPYSRHVTAMGLFYWSILRHMTGMGLSYWSILQHVTVMGLSYWSILLHLKVMGLSYWSIFWHVTVMDLSYWSPLNPLNNCLLTASQSLFWVDLGSVLCSVFVLFLLFLTDLCSPSVRSLWFASLSLSL